MKSDLHCHSIYSDGSFNIKEILDLAKHLKLDCIAITDHDTAAGVAEAIEYGNEIGIKVIAGIELSANSLMSVHVLGYNIDYTNPILNQISADLLFKRRNRKDLIVEKLHNMGINIDASRLDIDNVGRFHIARELVSQKFANCTAEVFDKFLGEGKPAFVPSNRMTPLRAVEIIKELGGVSVIAHPMQLYNSGKLEDLIKGLKPHGLGGLEVYYPSHSTEDVYQLSKIADKYRLIKTGGSDFHGVYKGLGNQLGACTCELPNVINK